MEERRALPNSLAPEPLWADGRGLSIARFKACENAFRMTFAPDVSMDLDLLDRTVTDSSAKALSPSEMHHFLADQVYPRIFAHRGAFILHAGSIRADNGAILLLGQSGRGKSTLVASFDQNGYENMGDDAIWVSSASVAPVARALYRSLRLLPDSLASLFGDGVKTAPVAPYTSKQRVMTGEKFGARSDPSPVRAIFSIGLATDAEIVISPLPPGAACMTLVENSFALDPSDVSQARSRMEEASALVRQVPMFEINYPRDYMRLPDIRQAILDQVTVLEAA